MRHILPIVVMCMNIGMLGRWDLIGRGAGGRMGPDTSV